MGHGKYIMYLENYLTLSLIRFWIIEPKNIDLNGVNISEVEEWLWEMDPSSKLCQSQSNKT